MAAHEVLSIVLSKKETKMALNNKESGSTNIPVDAASGIQNIDEINETRSRSTSIGQDGVRIIGFGGRDLYIMNSNQGSEYTNGLAADIQEAYNQLPANSKPKVNVLDKEVLRGLAFSTIIISGRSDNNSIRYFLVALEATGRNSMKAIEIANEVTNASRQPGQRVNVWTTDDALDDVLHEEAIRVLAKEWGEKTECVSVDGIVIGRNHGDNKTLALKIASVGYNSVTVDAALTTNKLKDLNLTEAVKNSPGSTLKLEANLAKVTATNEIERAIRQDFAVDLNLTDNSQHIVSINSQNQRDTLLRVSGFIDAIPAEVSLPVMQGQPPITQIRLHPHIVITNNSVKIPTPGYMLLGLISAMVMSNQNMWLVTTMPKNAKDMHNAGALNIMCNLEGNQNKVGNSLAADLTSKKSTTDETYNVLRNMFSLEPVLSYDIESFGPQTYYTSMLALAASPGNSEGKLAAASEIIETAHWLTNGAFPSDFSVNDIFINNGVVVPLGTWVDKSGDRDIRDIDLAFIANQTGDVALMNKWTLSSLPKERSGMDPFLTKTEIISNLIPDAEISGKAVRVTFTQNFIRALVNGAATAGLNANYEPEYFINEQHNIGMIGDYLAGAGLSNVSGFARQTTHAGPSFNTNFSNMGYNRY